MNASASDEAREVSATTPAHPDWSDRADTLSAWQRTKLAVVRGFLVGWVRLFGLNGLYRFGQFFGRCEYGVDYKRRGRVNERLAEMFPGMMSPEERRAAVLRYFQRTRCDKMIYTIFDRLPREALLNRIRFPDREAFDRLLAKQRGMYVAMSHFGPHHVAAMTMALLGYRVAGVRDRNEGALRRYIQQKFADTFPEFAAVRMFFADSFPREIFRCFKENFVVASALDVGGERVADGRLRTVPVKLFEESRDFLTGPIQMAIRCGAPVIQGFVLALPNFEYELVVHDTLLTGDARDESPEALAAVVQRYADGIAEYMRRHPCHITKIS